MIKIYFETKNPAYAELVATFESEELYVACLPILQENAKHQGFDMVTESVDDEEPINLKALAASFILSNENVEEALKSLYSASDDLIPDDVIVWEKFEYDTLKQIIDHIDSLEQIIKVAYESGKTN
jgi:hypothetical protein